MKNFTYFQRLTLGKMADVTNYKSGRNKKTRPVENAREEAMVRTLDNKKMMRRHADLINKLIEGKMDVSQALHGASADAFVQLLALMIEGDNEKTRLEAAKDVLDRAGFTKTQRVAVAGAIDTTATKEELIATILGLSTKTKELEIVEDDADNEADDKEE